MLRCREGAGLGSRVNQPAWFAAGFWLARLRALCYQFIMSIKEIREINRATPFHAYTVRTSDGDALHVPHPDFMFIPPIGETVIVVDQEGGKHLVDADHITKLEIRRTRSSKSTR